MCDGVDDDAPVVIAYIERDKAVVGASIAAVFDDDHDELTVKVKTTRDETVVVAAVLVDEDDDAGCSAGPCSGDDVGGVCFVYFSAPNDFSVPR